MSTHFSMSLRFVLKQKGWQDQKLAEVLGVHKSTVSRWLSDGQQPKTIKQLVSISKATGATPNDLLGITYDDVSVDTEVRIFTLLIGLPADLREVALECLEKLGDEHDAHIAALSTDEMELLREYRQLKGRRKDVVLAVLKEVAAIDK